MLIIGGPKPFLVANENLLWGNPSRSSWVYKSGGSNGFYMAVCQNLVPLVNIKIAGKWMFIPLKMVLIGIDP